MNGFTEPYWNIDQLLAWAGWRDQALVNFAQDGRSWGAICARARVSELKQKTRELWAASRLDQKQYVQFDKEFPQSPEQLALDRKMATLPFLDLDRIRAKCALNERGSNDGLWALNQIVSSDLRKLVDGALSSSEVHGPFQQKSFCHFPIEQYLLRVFRSGDLAATGNLPNETLAQKISPAAWAGLEIAISDETNRLGVWRIGRAAEKPEGRRLWRSAMQHPGAGDIENVRILREGILKTFPEIVPTECGAATRLSDDDIRSIIRAEEEKLRHRPPIRLWQNCAEMHKGGVTRGRFETIWRDLYPTPKKGRRQKA